MNDPSAAMQVALFAKLTASPALAALMAGAPRIYDKLPTTDPAALAQLYPFIRIGEDQALDRSDSCNAGWDFTATLHIFSRDPKGPRMDCKRISDAVLQAIANLDAPPTPAGYRIKDLSLGQARTFFEADGITAHGVVSIEYLVRPAA